MNLNQSFLALGFSKVEIDLYKVLLKHGGQTIESLVDKSDESHLKIHAALNRLLNIGIVFKSFQNEKSLYFAEHPGVLIQYLDQNENERRQAIESIKKDIDSLVDLSSIEKPAVKFYSGKESLKHMLQEHFMNVKSKNAYIIYPHEHVKKLFSVDEKKLIRQKRLDQGIHLRAIKSGGSELDRNIKLSETKYLTDKFSISAEIEILDDKVIIVDLEKTMTGVVIENNAIANTLLSLFKCLWSHL